MLTMLFMVLSFFSPSQKPCRLLPSTIISFHHCIGPIDSGTGLVLLGVCGRTKLKFAFASLSEVPAGVCGVGLVIGTPLSVLSQLYPSFGGKGVFELESCSNIIVYFSDSRVVHE